MIQETISEIQKVINKKKLVSTIPTIQHLHDSVITNFSIHNESLIIQNLDYQQIWHQINNHLNQIAPVCSKYLDKVERMIKFEKSQLQETQQAEHPSVDQQQQDNQQNQQLQEQPAQQYQQQQEQDNIEQQQDQQKMMDLEEDDVGLYGQLLDEQAEDQDQQNENPLDEQDDKFAMDREEQEQDNIQDENFQHFREIEMENNNVEGEVQEQGQNKDEITKLQEKLFSKEDWRLKGEVSSRERPLNSLIENNLQFKTGIKLNQQITQQYNEQVEQVIKKRVLDQMFDDRVRYDFAPNFRQHFTALPEISTEKNTQSLGELYETDFKNLLGLKQSKQQKQKQEILNLFKELNYKLDCLSNFHYIPKPTFKQAKISNQPLILRQQIIPINIAKENLTQVNKIKANFKSDKEITSKDRQGKRLKNKRIARQRMKEKEAKKMNRVVQYGGMTKFEAEARKKIEKSKKINKKVKYSQSGQFFKNLQENISNKSNSKPNPNLNKLKI